MAGLIIVLTFAVISGLIRSVAVSPDGAWIAVGFSSGIVSLIDLNTGVMQGTWKAHDSEILQVAH